MEGGSGDNVEREVVWQVYSPIKAGHFLPRHTELTSTRPIFLIEPQNRNTKKVPIISSTKFLFQIF